MVEKAMLVGLCTGRMPEIDSTDETLDELESLLTTAGGAALGRTLQNRDAPDPATFIGRGKVREVKELAADADLVVFDAELSPSQTRVLERELEKPVIDRSGLILDIFAKRAKTSEGKLQVELAQYRYLLPRLTGRGDALSRLGGGIGTRGPGESKLETDRRHIRERIRAVERALERVKRQRLISRRQRERRGTPVVSIVGYTNAGKSTLFNALTGGTHVTEADRLFETLDTTARQCFLGQGRQIVLTDTVGFIRKLPTHLIRAFRATLEELADADLLLHVADGSRPDWRAQTEACDAIISGLTGGTIPVLTVFNKRDLGFAEDVPPDDGGRHMPGTVYVSASAGTGLEPLKDRIGAALFLTNPEL
ncbi:MAG: GTPase HflX [Oscillospiraceae bacterium]|jgi:GTP-binding protein HflX|nr:GTPase HflX [Oscillospiraceae bacterium]